jgi:TonB family protein
MDDVYQDDQNRITDPKVPAGTRNRSQQYGPKHDNKTPGGGRKVDEAAFVRYGKNVERYIYSRWAGPPQSLLQGTFPETVIELTIEADGRVSRAEIVRSSGNRSMEASVQALLGRLDLLPRPPEGGITFRITLKTR